MLSYVLKSFFTCLSKTFCPVTIIFYSYFHSRKKYCLLFLRCALSSNDKTKSLSTPWKLGSIKLSKYWFVPSIDTFIWYLFQLIIFLKLDFDNCNSFAIILSWWSYKWNINFCISCCTLICYSGSYYNALFRPSQIKNKSQLIKCISRVLQKLFRYVDT